MKTRLGSKIIEFKGLRPSPGDILVIKKWKGFGIADHELIMQALEESTDVAMTVLFVKALSDVKLLSEKQLNKWGLKRIDD